MMTAAATATTSWKRSRFKASGGVGGGSVGGGSGGWRRNRGSFDSDDEDINWDKSRTSFDEAVRSSLRVVVSKAASGGGITSKSKRLAHLDGIIRMWSQRAHSDGAGSPGSLRLEEVLLCLRIPLSQESPEVRAHALRTVRFLISGSDDVRVLHSINVHYLVVRCIDIDLDNKAERIQALKLVRKVIYVGGPDQALYSFAKALAALVQDGASEKDGLHKAALAVLCELCVLNSSLFIEANGVPTLSHCLLDFGLPRLGEAVLGCLLALHNDPLTRFKANVRLGLVVAPFTEFRYVHSGEDVPSPAGGGATASTAKDNVSDRDFRFFCSEQVLLSTLRSWTGLLHMTETDRNGVSHLQSLVDIIHLDNDHVRKRLINLLYEVLNLRTPVDASSFDTALESMDPSFSRSTWKLAEGFVAQEGLDILPELAKTRPNLVESHKGLLLACLLDTGLPNTLVKVIVSTNEELSVLATILLGELLHMAYILLPRELNATSHCLPALLLEVSSLNPIQSNRASEAVDALHRLHDLKKRGPIASSLFLDQIMSGSGCFCGETFIGDRLHSPNWVQLLKKQSDSRVGNSIRLSQVNDVTVDPSNWKWDMISAVFRWPNEAFKSMEAQEHRTFVKRIVEFFKPSGSLFCHEELTNKKTRFLTRTGCYVLDFLVSSESVLKEQILSEFLSDVQRNFRALTEAGSAHDCFFSPTRIATTACQYYFLFVGRLSRTEVGRRALDQHLILQTFVEFLSMRSDMYLKLVISSLDFGCTDWGSRNLISKAMREGSDSCRLYATRFIGVLIRSRTANVTHWGIELLVGQLFDHSKMIAWAALEILEDACDDKMNLEAVICVLKSRPLSCLDHLGFRGSLVFARFLASTNGFTFLTQNKYIDSQLALWAATLNRKYVGVIEELVNDGLTRHQLGDNRTYGSRISQGSHQIRNAFVPPHLYGLLSSTKDGFSLLINEDPCHKMLKLLRLTAARHQTVDQPLSRSTWLEVKAAVWGVAHIASSPQGALWVDKEGGITALISIAETCSVYSIRGAAFHALGLVAMSKPGSQVLYSNGWCSLKYGRDERWPVLEEWLLAGSSHLDQQNLPADYPEECCENETVYSSLGFSLDTGLDHDLDSTAEPTHFRSQSTAEEDPGMSPSATYIQTETATPSDNTGLEGDTSVMEDSSRSSSAIGSRRRLSSIFRSMSLAGNGGSKRGKDRVESTTRTTPTLDESVELRRPQSFKFHKKFKLANLSKQRPSSQSGNSRGESPLSPTGYRDGKQFATEHNVDRGDRMDGDDPAKTTQCIVESPLHDFETRKNRVAPIATPENSAGSSDGISGATEKTVQNAADYAEPASRPTGSVPEKLPPIVSSIISEESNIEAIEDIDGKCQAIEFSGGSRSADYRQLSMSATTSTPVKVVASGTESTVTETGTGAEMGQVTTSDRPTGIQASHLSHQFLQKRTAAVVRRTGQRALSESEAQNYYHKSHKPGTGAVGPPSAAAIDANVSRPGTGFTSYTWTRPSDNYQKAFRKLSSTAAQQPLQPPAARISLISGSSQSRNLGADLQGTSSITSVSSGGSWTDNMGFLTLRNLRPGPQLVDIEGPEGSGRGFSGIGIVDVGGNNVGAFGAGSVCSGDGISYTGIKRTDSMSMRYRSLDYRITRMRRYRFDSSSDHFRAGQQEDADMTGGQQSYITGLGTGRHKPRCRGSNLGGKSGGVGVGGNGPEPVYWGIAFPIRLDSLYCRTDAPSGFSPIQELKSPTDKELPDFNNDMTITSITAAYKFPQLFAKKGLVTHVPDKCLSCFRLLAPCARSRSGSTSALHLKMMSSGPTSPTSDQSGLRRQLGTKSLMDAGVEDESTNLAEGPRPHFGGTRKSKDSDDSMMAQVLRRREVLKLVSCMNATVGAKSAEQSLLRIKQNHPSTFKDLCLYSEVCLLLSEYSFRLFSRRFVQELFMDVDFHDLYVEPYQLLGLDLSDDSEESDITTRINGDRDSGNNSRAKTLGRDSNLAKLTEDVLGDHRD